MFFCYDFVSLHFLFAFFGGDDQVSGIFGGLWDFVFFVCDSCWKDVSLGGLAFQRLQRLFQKMPSDKRWIFTGGPELNVVVS